jgi:hypothetical protein
MSANQFEDMQLVGQAPNRLEFRRSGATVGFFIMIFSLFWGGMPTCMMISLIASGRSDGPMCVFPIFTVVGLVVFAFGLSMLYSGTTVIFDGNRNVIIITRRSMASEQKEEHSVKEIREVLYSTEIRRRSKGGSDQVWLVDLIGEIGDSLRMGAQASELAMRARAELLAKHLKIPMRDTTSGEELVRMPEELDRALAESMKITGEQPSVSSSPPEGSKILVERAPRYVRYLLPAAGLTVSTGGSGLFMMIWTGFACLWTFGAFATVLSSHEKGVALLFPLLGLPFVIIGLTAFIPIIKGIMGKDEIVITFESIKTSKILGPWRTGSREIPLKKVEEITGNRHSTPFPSSSMDQQLSPELNNIISIITTGSRPLRIVSDEAILRVGAGLSDSDSAWLYDSIRAEIFRHGRK